MNKFEAVILISPEISTDSKDKLCDEFKRLINENSGKIIDTEDWGLRDLSYKIGNFTKAFYSFFQIEFDGVNIEKINKNLTQNENFIRHIFIKVNKHQELPTKLENEKK
jgi:small subunit ribosomal protein S6